MENIMKNLHLPLAQQIQAKRKKVLTKCKFLVINSLTIFTQQLNV